MQVEVLANNASTAEAVLGKIETNSATDITTVTKGTAGRNFNLMQAHQVSFFIGLHWIHFSFMLQF